MKIAIVHDYLMQMGGAEKVVEVLHSMFPEAPIYTSAYDPEVMPAHFRDWNIHTTFLQRLPAKRKTHRAALLLYPTAFESFDLSGFDLVISSSSAFAKGVITQPHTAHICYTYTPMRFAWSPHSYMKEERLSMMARTLLGPGLHYMRTWDALASMRVDNYVAISRVVADRIQKFYRRDCDIVFPPVDTSHFRISDQVDDYYLMVSRLAPYKRLELAVEACNQLKRPLKIVGGGRYRAKLEAIAGPTIEFLGRVSDEELPILYSRAKAYIMPGVEDFCMAPVEANASGRPVIAFAAGGALDTQIDGFTGVLFHEPTVDSLVEAMHSLDRKEFDSEAIRAHSQMFDTESFKNGMNRVIERVMESYQAGRASRRKAQFSTALAGADGDTPWSPQLVPAAHQDKIPVAVNGHYLNGNHLNGNHSNGTHSNGGHSSGTSSNGQIK